MIFNLLNVLSHPAVLTGRVIAILTALQSFENAKFNKGFKNYAHSSIVSKVSPFFSSILLACLVSILISSKFNL